MKNNFYPIAGLLVFVIPFLGLPGGWRNLLLSALGLAIFIYSIWPSVSRWLTTKPKIPGDDLK
jgi:hypothetical protein